MNLYTARQPVFDCESRIFGYELLYRQAAVDQHAAANDATRMSSDVIVQAFLEMGVERLTGGKRGFVNFGREMLVSRAFEVLDPAVLVIEVLEDVEADAEIIRACEEAVAAGYTLALDDFVQGGSQDALLPLASIVKVDLLGRSAAEIAEIAARLRPTGVRLLAEKVEDEQAFQAARDAGFSLFQGYHFSKPETVAHSANSVEAMRILPLMNAIQDDEVLDHWIAAQFSHDPVLSHKLLRIVNSASYGGRGVDSILHAIQIVGRKTLYRWLTLLLTSSLASTSGPSHELVQGTLVRARLLELLAQNSGANSGALFLVGMFSNLDTLMRLPIEELLRRVHLAGEVSSTLLREAGSAYLTWLELAEAYERGDWQTAAARANGLQLDAVALPELYVEALQWANETMQLQAA